MKCSKTSLSKIKVLISAMVVFCLLTTSCKKRPVLIDELPPITTEGKNTFGCLLNGKVWIPGHTISSDFGVRYRENRLIITVTRGNLKFQYRDAMVLTFQDISTIGSYDINSDNAEIYANIDDRQYGLGKGGKVTITFLDKTKKIISGEFSVALVDNASGKSLAVSEGRFDAIYKDN